MTKREVEGTNLNISFNEEQALSVQNNVIKIKKNKSLSKFDNTNELNQAIKFLQKIVLLSLIIPDYFKVLSLLGMDYYYMVPLI